MRIWPKRLLAESSSCLKVSRPKETWLRFLSHSKNETVTPPLFKNISGITRQSPRESRILSAAGVVGPFAASAITCKVFRNYWIRIGIFEPIDLFTFLFLGIYPKKIGNVCHFRSVSRICGVCHFWSAVLAEFIRDATTRPEQPAGSQHKLTPAATRLLLTSFL